MSTDNNPMSDPHDGSPDIIEGHRYDGIQEYDNPMPGWWTAIFWVTGIFGLLYIIGLNTGWVNTYEDDLESSLQQLEEVRQEFQSQNPVVTIDSTTLAAVVSDPARIAAGMELFSGQCAACHAPDGGGLIGPNLTDEFWIHGGSNMDIFEIIRVGVPEKGMAPWEAIYTAEERASLVAYVRSLVGTTPATAKEPQGEVYEGA
ncbi:MAG: c-type cytochrome [Rhodothermales bacterium]|nr:c-type cytochrome [Rhodothermales bacterium]